jgi:hypothetical protein
MQAEMGRQKDIKVHQAKKDMHWIVRKGIFWDRQAAGHSRTRQEEGRTVDR